MNNNWQTKKLGEVCSVIKKQDRHKNLPYVGMEDIESNTGRFTGSRNSRNVKSTSFYFNSENILYGRLRPYLNKVLLPDFEGHCSTEIFPFKVSNLLDKKYFFYWITSDEIVKKINSTCTGTRMPRANINEILSFEINFPSFQEQKRIVKILDEVFEKIAKAKENTKKNLKNSCELYESYLQSVLTNQDNKWEERKLGDVYDVRDGTHDSPKYHNDGYALITSKNLKHDVLDYKAIKYISEKDYKKINERSRVDKGDILFAMIGTIGNSVIVGIEPDFAIKNVALFKIPKEQDSYFLKYFLDSKYVIDKMMREAKGTTQKFVGLGYLRNFTIHLPKLTEQELIVKKLDALSGQTEKLEENYRKKISDLEELKKSVLAKAFAGEL